MSILNVEHLTHGFGDRAIFEDVSFRLLAGEHIGLVGANGEGLSLIHILTGTVQPAWKKLRRQMKKKCSSSRSVFTDGMHMKMMCREKISIPCRS